MTMEKQIMEALDNNPLRIVELAEKVAGRREGITDRLKYLVRAGFLKRENYYYSLTAKGHAGIVSGSDFVPQDSPDDLYLLFYAAVNGKLTAERPKQLEKTLRYKKYAY